MFEPERVDNVIEIKEYRDGWVDMPPNLVGPFKYPGHLVYDRLYPYQNAIGELIGFRVYFNPDSRLYYSYSPGNNKRAKYAHAYNFPKVAGANGKVVHIFDEELHVDIANEIGLIATCTPELDPIIELGLSRDTQFVIWECKKAEQFALALHRNRYVVKVAKVPIGTNLANWKPSLEELNSYVETIRAWLPASEAVNALQGEFNFPAVGFDLNSEAFAGAYYANLYNNRVRFCPEQKSWLLYDGKVWDADSNGHHAELVKDMALRVKEAWEQLGDSAAGKQLGKLAERVQSEAGKQAVLKMARTDPKIAVSKTDLDGERARHLLACKNGVINLKTGQLEDHSPEHLITKFSPYEVDFADPKKPLLFEQFIKSTFQDPEVEAWVYKFLGYCLTGQTYWQNFCAWIGKTGTGKSQLQTVMRGLLGGLCGDLAAQSLLKQNGERTPGTDSDLAGMAGKRLIFASELPLNALLDEATVKAMSGQDVLRVKLMGGNKFNMKVDGKLVFTANERMRISADDAVARRLVELRFEHQPAEIIKDFGQLMLAEEGGKILGLLASQAALTYYPDSLNLPPRMEQWKQNWLQEVDTLTEWFESSVIVTTHKSFHTARELWDSYCSWCTESGIPHDVEHSKFKRFLLAQGCTEGRVSKGRGYSNVALVEVQE